MSEPVDYPLNPPSEPRILPSPPPEVLHGLTERERGEVQGMIQSLHRGDDGWNLCCNVCGTFGASWRKDPEVRTATGDLAACPRCYAAIRRELDRFRKEQDRHRNEMAALTVVRFPVQPQEKTINVAYRTGP